jgi:hypothetical protein
LHVSEKCKRYAVSTLDERRSLLHAPPLAALLARRIVAEFVIRLAARLGVVADALVI